MYLLNIMRFAIEIYNFNNHGQTVRLRQAQSDFLSNVDRVIVFDNPSDRPDGAQSAFDKLSLTFRMLRNSIAQRVI